METFTAGYAPFEGDDNTPLRPDSPALAAQYVTQAISSQLAPIATNCGPSFQSGNALSDGVLTGGTARLRHVALFTGVGLRLVFSNHYASASYKEESGPNVITVKAAIEYPDTYIFPVTFNGADSVEIAPGGNAISDPIGLEFAKGTTFHSRTFVAVGPGEYFPRGGFGTAGSGTVSWHNYANPTGADLTRTGSADEPGGYSEYVLGPSAILSHPTAPVTVIGGVGDSILAGTGDFQNGWMQRWLDGDYAFTRVAYPGEGIGTGWSANQGLHRYRRVALLEQAGVSHVIAAHVVNDLGTAYATLQAALVLYWKQLSRFGPVYATTCTPQTTSTDSWATLNNQTIADGARETKRLDYNAWLRDGAPLTAGVAVAVGTVDAIRAGETGHPLAGYIELADQVESARDSGKWRVDGGANTDDGTHPNSLCAAAIASGLSAPSTYFGAITV